MKKLDDLTIELIQVREAIDMAETVLEMKKDADIDQQLEKLRKEEAVLRAKLWNEVCK